MLWTHIKKDLILGCFLSRWEVEVNLFKFDFFEALGQAHSKPVEMSC